MGWARSSDSSMSLEFGFSLHHVVASAMVAVNISVARWFESFALRDCEREPLLMVISICDDIWIQMATPISDACQMLRRCSAGLCSSR